MLSVLAHPAGADATPERRQEVAQKADNWRRTLVDGGDDPETARRRAVVRGVANLEMRV